MNLLSIAVIDATQFKSINKNIQIFACSSIEDINDISIAQIEIANFINDD